METTNVTKKRSVLKIVIGICLLVVVVGAAATIGVSAITGKSIWEMFYSKEEEIIPKELMDYSGQSYTIDDYTITLDRTLYDSKTGIGYYVMAITKKGGKPEATLNKWGQSSWNGCFGDNNGEENRFKPTEFSEDLTGGGDNYFFEFVGDTLYEYVGFNCTPVDDLKIELIDYANKSKDNKNGYDTYVYDIKNSSKYKSAELSEGINLYISQLGIAVYASGQYKIEVEYKDGSSKVLVDESNDIVTGWSSETSGTDQPTIEQFTFKEPVDVDQISKIIVNDEAYDVK